MDSDEALPTNCTPPPSQTPPAAKHLVPGQSRPMPIAY